MQILLTGATGFIGSAILKKLRRCKYHVKTFAGDVRKLGDWEKNLEGGEIIFHFAGIKTETKKDFEINTFGTKNLFLSAAKLGKIPKKIVFASTGAVYLGSIYGQSKYEAEKICQKYAKKLGITLIIFRFGTVVGRGIRLESGMSGPIAVWLNELLNDRPIRVFQRGQQTRPYLHIDDLVSAIILSLKKLPSGIYNVVGEQVKMKDLANWLREAVGKGEVLLINSKPTAVDPQELTVPSLKLRSFDWRPTKTIKEAVEEIVKTTD